MNSLPHARRNFILFFLDYALFGIGFSMMGNTTVVPDFVRHLTASEAIIGLSGALYPFAWLVPQLLFAQIINRSTRRKPFMTWTVIPFRVTMAILAGLIGLVGRESQTTILVTFLSFYTIFAIGDGLVTIVWADMMGSSVPHRWRGVLFGMGQVVVTVATLGTREIVRNALGPIGPPFPYNYGQLFGIAAVLFIIAGVALSSLVEEKTEEIIEPGPPMRQYLPYLGNVLRTDREFQHFTLTRTLLDLTLMSAPFYIVFGLDFLKLSNGILVGDSVLLTTLGSAAAALLLGWLSHRWGSRAVITMAAVGCCLHPALALLSFSLGQPALYGAFFLIGFISASTVPGYFDWIITHAPPDRRPIYVGLTNTISAVSHLSPILGGLVLVLSGTSYSVLFMTALCVAVVGLGSTFFLSEPRKRLAMPEAEPAKVEQAG